jgi:FkbM family methyltransferase
VGFADIVGPSGVVHAFEPLPLNLDLLQSTVALNANRRIVLHSSAVGAKCGRLLFSVPPAESSGIGHLMRPGANHPGLIEVECVTLDSLADQLGPSKAIFIDAEGAELEILRGARGYITDHRPTIVLEASPRLLKRSGACLRALHDAIRDMGYLPFRIGRLGLGKVDPGDDAHASNWFCAPAESEGPSLVRRMLRKCGLLPCIGTLNPITWSAQQ